MELIVHYYQFNIGNYRRKAHYLSLLEHGIYRILLDTYYLDEKPLNSDHATLMRTHSIRTTNEVKAFEIIIAEFFILHDDGYHHETCDKEIAKYHDKSAKASASAKARWDNKAKTMRTHSEGNANQEPLTTNHKPKEKVKRFKPPSTLEVSSYCVEKNYSVDAEAFIGFYESNGWKVGKNPMKSWKAALTTWHKRNGANNETKRQGQNTGFDTRSRAKKVSDKLDEIAKQDIEQNGFTSELDSGAV